MVVQGHIAYQRLLQVLSTVEAVGLQDIRNTAIESLDHAIGSRCPGFGEPMLNAQCFAQLVKLVVATVLTLTASKEAIREFFAVVREQLGDLDGTSLM